ncbi:MAG: nicotinate (nicotinamide) nucleotide adenylyltransferase [Bacteriovoracaceae bacterium]|nr:nicotinate (nicotinamide) nucleotide adenylyltransferase [Bacteroidota bacterium]
MNIGIFGGTFNPPHIGHLIVAEQVRTELSLDTIIFIPSYISPHKQQGESDLAVHRLSMTRLAIAGNQYFECSDIEVMNTDTSYTIHTLELLKKKYPGDVLFLIIGMDNYLTFHLWKDPQNILTMASLIILNRPGYPKQVNELIGTKNARFVDVPDIDISSSAIRQRVKNNVSIRYLVSDDVEKYIYTHQLFR